MALQSLDIKRRSASSTEPPSIRQGIEITKLIDVTACIGCKACQVACSEWNDIRDEVGNNTGVYDNPNDLTANSWTVMRFNEVEENGKLEWLIRKDGCMHCENPGCLKACPSPGAIIQYTNGIVDFHQENCIGCGYCITACPFDIPRLSKKDDKAYKCTLCSDRVAVGQEPACVKTCPTGAIRFGSQEDMVHLAQERVDALKKRGFEKAGTYPPRAGRTHVMYVLHHADRPELYNDLGTKSRAKPIIDLWKGLLKPLATFGIAGSILFGFFHYITVGPYDADSDDRDREIIDPDDSASSEARAVVNDNETAEKEENI